jgi:hypothetical protein
LAPAKKAESLITLTQLRERAADDKKAFQSADEALKLDGITDTLRAYPASFEARYFSKQGNKEELRRLEARISSFKAKSPELSDALSETRFYLADKETQDFATDLVTLSTKDPSGAFDRFLSKQKDLTGLFLRSCVPTGVSYCAPALFKLARFFEKVHAGLSRTTPPTGAQQKTASAFTAKKKATLDALSKEIKTHDMRALMALSSGNTDPSWTQLILFQNTSDFLFDRVSGENGSGFIQWKDLPSAPKEDKKKPAKKQGGSKK